MPLQPEQILQINFVNWFNHEFPELEECLFHFANERKCSIQQGVILKRMGVKRGVNDLFLCISQENKAGLWLELKVDKKKLTKEQIDFGKLMSKNNYRVAAAWTLEEAKEVFMHYLKNYIANRELVALKNCS
jgi:hypothetical protein